MSASLLKIWRAQARTNDRAAASLHDGDFTPDPAIVAAMRSYAEALRRCADSLERSMAIAARKNPVRGEFRVRVAKGAR